MDNASAQHLAVRSARLVSWALLVLYSLFLLYGYGLTIVLGILTAGEQNELPDGPAEIVAPLGVIFGVVGVLIGVYLIVMFQHLSRVERVWRYVLVVLSLGYYPIGAFFLHYL